MKKIKSDIGYIIKKALTSWIILSFPGTNGHENEGVSSVIDLDLQERFYESVAISAIPTNIFAQFMNIRSFEEGCKIMLMYLQ